MEADFEGSYANVEDDIAELIASHRLSVYPAEERGVRVLIMIPSIISGATIDEDISDWYHECMPPTTRDDLIKAVKVAGLRSAIEASTAHLPLPLRNERREKEKRDKKANKAPKKLTNEHLRNELYGPSRVL